MAAKKHTWEARVYWQQIDLNSLDPNLIDSDFFEGPTNLQGIFLAAAHCPLRLTRPRHYRSLYPVIYREIY